MQSTFKIEKLTRQVRLLLVLFMIALIVSGITALPIEKELNFINRFFTIDSGTGQWLEKVYTGIHETGIKYPFLFYGYDWLAFAHIVIAIVFIGPFKDPVRNIWVIEFAVYACMMIIPFALIAGHFREIPFWWRLIDCSFGIIGILPLLVCYRKIRIIESLQTKITLYETGY